MNYSIYILYTPVFIRTYVGQTDNLPNRLSTHNSGKVKSTKAFRPWILIHSESFSYRSEAMKREKWFKSNAGTKKITEILKQYLNGSTKSLSVSSR